MTYEFKLPTRQQELVRLIALNFPRLTNTYPVRS